MTSQVLSSTCDTLRTINHAVMRRTTEYSASVSKLINLGEPTDKWINYLSFGLTHANIPELIHMASDETVWEEDDNLPSVYRQIHAWRALSQLKAVEAVPALIELFRWVDEYNDDWSGEDLPEALAKLGPDVIDPVADYLVDESHGRWARVTAAATLTLVGTNFPESAARCAAAICRTLQEYQRNDPDLNGSLIAELATLKRPETYALVEEAFGANMVDRFVMGNWEDFQLLVGLISKEQREEKEDIFVGDMPNYGFPKDKVDRDLMKLTKASDKKEKNKRKQVEKSRKKNRKKK